MQAILFPHTYIPAAVCEAVAAYFRPLRIYQPTSHKIPAPLQALSQKGSIKIVIPVRHDDEKTAALLLEYRKMAELHQDGLRDYLKRRTQTVPFFDESAISRLKGDIRKGASKAEKEEPLLKARLFLQMAQELDLQNEEISRKLEETRRTEKRLFSDLVGGSETSFQTTMRTPSIQNVASSGHMLQSRIVAWAQLFWEDNVPEMTDGPIVLITTCREALEHLLERLPESEPILTGAPLPIHQNPMSEDQDWHREIDRILSTLPGDAETRLAGLAASFETESQKGLPACLTLYRVTGESAAGMFADLIERSDSEHRGEFLKKTGQTFLGSLEVDFGETRSRG